VSEACEGCDCFGWRWLELAVNLIEQSLIFFIEAVQLLVDLSGSHNWVYQM